MVWFQNTQEKKRYGNHLDDFLQHGLGDVDEEEGVCAVGGDADKLVTVVVGRQQVHL